MYVIDRNKFSNHSKYGCSQSDFALCITNCCKSFLVEDDELLDYYTNPENLGIIIHFEPNSICPFCSSVAFSFTRIESFNVLVEYKNPWNKYFVDGKFVADVELNNREAPAAELFDFLIGNFDGFSFCLRFSLFKDTNTKQISIHGVFSEFSSYFRNNMQILQNPKLRELFRLIELTFRTVDAVNDAVCTCFLENIAGESFSDVIKPYLGTNSFEFYKKYDG